MKTLLKTKKFAGQELIVYKPQHYIFNHKNVSYEIFASEWGRQWKCWRIKDTNLTFGTLTEAIEWIQWKNS